MIAQEQQPEQEKKEMPKLEIPEITIIGKKAITLPFARKGEIYDVTRYVAPPPDTSLLGDRGPLKLPVVSWQRLRQAPSPWRLSAEGGVGSFPTMTVGGNLEYRKSLWSVIGRGDYQTTQGHTDNASASLLEVKSKAQAMIETDNDFLKTLRGWAGIDASHRTYGLFGLKNIANSDVKRTVDNLQLDAGIGSLQQQGSTFSLNFSTDIWNASDDGAAKDSQVTSSAPLLRAAFAADIGTIRLLSELKYLNASYDNQIVSISQSLLEIEAAAQWNPTKNLAVKGGGLIATTSGSSTGSQHLVMPLGMMQWNFEKGTELSLWWRPKVHLPTYGEFLRANPYLMRTVEIRPSKTPLNFGGTIVHQNNKWMIDVTVSYSTIENKDITVADDSGRIWLDYNDAVQTQVQWNGSLSLSSSARVKSWGAFDVIREKGKSVQLPMNPVIDMTAKMEFDVLTPLTVWSGIEYRSEQNADRNGSAKLPAAFLLSVGASYRVMKPLLISGEILNLLNSEYYWWYKYRAPGLTFMARAYLTFQ